MNEIEQLRAALRLARPYVRLAAERPTSNPNEERNRADAAEKLKVIDAALARTDGAEGNSYHTNCHEPLMKDDPT